MEHTPGHERGFDYTVTRGITLTIVRHAASAIVQHRDYARRSVLYSSAGSSGDTCPNNARTSRSGTNAQAWTLTSFMKALPKDQAHSSSKLYNASACSWCSQFAQANPSCFNPNGRRKCTPIESSANSISLGRARKSASESSRSNGTDRNTHPSYSSDCRYASQS